MPALEMDDVVLHSPLVADNVPFTLGTGGAARTRPTVHVARHVVLMHRDRALGQASHWSDIDHPQNATARLSRASH